MPPTPVETTVVEATRIADRFTGVGTVEPSESVTVVFEVDGRVVDLPFVEGGRVARGAVLARLDDAQPRAELERARALLEHARTEQQRLERLVAQQISAPQALDNARADLRVAEANVTVAEAHQAKMVVTAPFGGVLGSRLVSPGAYVHAGEALTDLAALEQVKVSFSAPERLLSVLRPGASVAITTTASPGRVLEGSVSLVDPMLDAGTRSAHVVARVDNADGALLPGMSATVDVVLAERNDAIAVPSEAVFAEGTQALVYVVQENGTVKRQPVVLGTRQAELVEVREGLSAGQRIVRTGHQKLFDGAKVMPIDDAATRDGAAK
jgi:membrane fusion protein (multidrug efflux system)